MVNNIQSGPDEPAAEVELDLLSFDARASDERRDISGGPDEGEPSSSLAGPTRVRAAPRIRTAQREPDEKALTIIARFGGMLDQLAVLRGDHRELLTKTLAISTRLGGIADELSAIRTALRRGPSELLQARLLPLLEQQTAAPVVRALVPFAEISPGIRVGFEPSACAELIVRPHADGGAGQGNTRNVVELSLQPPGTWLSLEAPLRWDQLVDAGEYEFSFGGHVNRKTGCQISLRFYREAEHDDVAIGEFHLESGAANHTMAGPVTLPSTIPHSDAALICVFYPPEPVDHPEPALEIKLHQARFYLVGRS